MPLFHPAKIRTRLLQTGRAAYWRRTGLNQPLLPALRPACPRMQAIPDNQVVEVYALDPSFPCCLLHPQLSCARPYQLRQWTRDELSPAHDQRRSPHSSRVKVRDTVPLMTTSLQMASLTKANLTIHSLTTSSLQTDSLTTNGLQTASLTTNSLLTASLQTASLTTNGLQIATVISTADCHMVWLSLYPLLRQRTTACRQNLVGGYHLRALRQALHSPQQPRCRRQW